MIRIIISQLLNRARNKNIAKISNSFILLYYKNLSIYRPGTYILMSLNGKEYEPVDYVNHNEKAFRNIYQYISPYKSTLGLIYQFPVDQKLLVLYAADCAVPIAIITK